MLSKFNEKKGNKNKKMCSIGPNEKVRSSQKSNDIRFSGISKNKCTHCIAGGVWQDKSTGNDQNEFHCIGSVFY